MTSGLKKNLSSQVISKKDITIPRMLHISIRYQEGKTEENLHDEIIEYIEEIQKKFPEEYWGCSSESFIMKEDGEIFKNNKYNIYFFDQRYYYISMRARIDGTEYPKKKPKISLQRFKEILKNMEKNNWKTLNGRKFYKNPKQIFDSAEKYYNNDVNIDLDLDFIFEEALLIEEYGVNQAREKVNDWENSLTNLEELLGQIEFDSPRISSLKRYLEIKLGFKLFLDTCKFPTKEGNEGEMTKAFIIIPKEAFEDIEGVKLSILEDWWFIEFPDFYPKFEFIPKDIIKTEDSGKISEFRKIRINFPFGYYIPYIIKKLKPDVDIFYKIKPKGINFRDEKEQTFSYRSKLTIETNLYFGSCSSFESIDSPLLKNSCVSTDDKKETMERNLSSLSLECQND